MKNNHEIILKQYAAYCKEQPLYLGTAGSYGMEMLTIIREGVWAEYDILAAFHPPVGAAVQVRVGANNQIDVPIEATAEKGMGEIVFAGYKEGVRQIAVDVLYKVAPSSGASGTEPAEPAPDVVQQIMLAANAAEKLAQSVRDDADVGKFTGAKGDKGDIGPTGPKGEQGPKGERGEKGDPGKDAAIDATLSHAGEAADAAEVGKLKEDLGNTIYKGLINGFDKDNTVGGYLSNNGNVASDSRFVTSDYFDVDENKTYYALQMVNAVKYDTVSYICFYDSSKTFIADGYFYASSCTSPNGSKYARVTFPNNETVKARCMFTSIETPDKYYPFGYEYSIITKDVSELKTSKFENRLYGKTMAILGDSMAKGHTLKEEQTWAYKIANRNGMTYQKFAMNGMFITTGHGDADANCLLEQAKKINNNPDIIVIHMGTNDRNNNVELGTWTSGNTDTTNLFGALRVAFTYLAENFPLAQVMFITPYYYQEQTDYIGSIEKACMFVGWHCKNNKQGGIWAWNPNVRNALFLDNVHLNEVGQERVSYEYEGFMRTFM